MKFIKWISLILFALLAVRSFRKELQLISQETRAKSKSKHHLASDGDQYLENNADKWIN